MARKNDLTMFARDGYAAAPIATNPHMASSPAALAWDLGSWFKKTGKTEPQQVSMSRGYTMNANGMRFNLDDVNNISRIS